MEVDLRRLFGQAAKGADRHRGVAIRLPRKIAVMGASCSGKTTLAKAVAGKLGVPHVELDALHWGPNWSEPTAEEFGARVGEAIAGDDWVVDGNYGGKLGDTVVSQADLIVWLDLPLRMVLP